MIIVLDTNVLVSALLNPFGKPGRILDLILSGDLALALDDRLLAEYREVLGRERFDFAAEDVNEVLTYFQTDGVLVPAAPIETPLPDPDDLPFLEVALATEADALVTGNSSHYPTAARLGATVLSPAEFLTYWHARSKKGESPETEET